VRPGVELLEDAPGLGVEVQRHRVYDIRLRIWLSRGEPVRWKDPHDDRLEDDGTTLFATLRVDREQMIAGLFHGVEGMRIGGTRRIRVAPHLAYRETGIPGVIPPNALLIIEVEILAERT
jgi:hypothetical protein